ncbi:carboxylesterase 1F [Anabrus simplex]|uniref:carboxylesterase 1F n=1 Tax=Anabrus simplex TaxID=316456 RepID=UPI0035A352F6
MIFVGVPLLLCVAVTTAQTLVNIPGLGSLQGKTSESFFTKRTIYEFQGIPFAERPERFMRSTKKAPWEGVLNATSHGRPCPQHDLLNISDSGDLEDCLFLDVYTPKVDNASKLPVLFYIHGGAFVLGSSQSVTPGFFLEHDIVIVSIQYRLGAFGFLSLGIEEIPGNAGMYDQLLALQWTYDNIQYFGGDPNQITVAGVSAGAVSAGLLYVSPLAQDIIKKVMLFSGSAVTFWAVGIEPVSDGLSIAKYAGCEPTEQLVSCLRSLDPLSLVRAYDQFQADERSKAHSEMRGTNPVLDGNFLDRLPLDIMSDPKFKGRPMLMSVTKHEGILWEPVISDYLRVNNLTDDYRTLKYGLPDVLLTYTEIKDKSCVVGTAITDEYFKQEELGNYSAMRPGIIDYVGSAYFKGPARKMAELNDLRGGATYLATFNYYSPATHLNGVVPHGGDQMYLFPYGNIQFSEEDLAIIRNITTLYANFISSGTPHGVSWEPYSLESGTYLVINTTMTTKTPFEQEYTIAEREGFHE